MYKNKRLIFRKVAVLEAAILLEMVSTSQVIFSIFLKLFKTICFTKTFPSACHSINLVNINWNNWNWNLLNVFHFTELEKRLRNNTVAWRYWKPLFLRPFIFVSGFSFTIFTTETTGKGGTHLFLYLLSTTSICFRDT